MTRVNFSTEELQLVREYRLIRLRAPAVEPNVENGEVDVDGDRPVITRVPSGKDCLVAWRQRYPNLASTDQLVARIPGHIQTLLSGLSRIPEPPRNRRATPQEVRAVREEVEAARRAVSLWARHLVAIEVLRSVVVGWSGVRDVVPLDRLRIGREVMYDPRYRNYDRWRLRLARTKPKVREANAEYEAGRRATSERRTYQREYQKKYRRRAAG